jgi:hypothetical protein
MLVRASTYVANTSRYQGPNPLLIVVLLVAGFVGFASGFYWLMQPTVVKNNGLAGYQPPAATVISAKPAVLPPPTEPLVALAPPAPEIPEAAAVASRKDKEVAKREARTTTPRRAVARERNPMLDYAYSQRQQGGWGQGGWGHQGGWGGGFSSQNYSYQGSRRWF